MNKWLPEPNAHMQRRMGKTLEECGELVAVAGRVMIQGLNEIDPSSGKSNRQRLLEEMADVYAQITESFFALNVSTEEGDSYWSRVERKREQMNEWEAHYHEEQK